MEQVSEHITSYIKEVNQLYQTGLTTEHSFRPALQRLLASCTGCKVINEPSRIACGAPDLTILHQNLPIAYVEAKDIEDGDLDGRRKNKEQFDRYKASLDTIIFTDYLDFHLYEHGEWILSARLAEIQGNKIRLSDSERFTSLIEHVKAAKPQRITSASKLAQIMAGKARLLRNIIEQALIQDGETPSELRSYMEAFRQVLIHDITPKTFADIYAQTIAYGMFAARMHDASPEDFSRAEAANLIPKSNPFLRKIFQQVAGYDLDERIAWIVDDLVNAFAATDMERILDGFGKNTQQTDPILHFYEDFLYQYDPAAKKQCGVYYTPQPVVEFIVRAIDDILRTEFNLPLGLADTGRLNGHHRVQVLDPATGTGTFLAETVRQIKRDLGGQMGAWNSYVPEHLLPRLHGFELMMAPYTIAHLKLDMEIGLPAQQRLQVYLTNSLEEYKEDAGTLFGYYLAEEANAASQIKKDAPVMIVMGNPPYSVSSNNKGEWINKLLDDYKKNLNERNIQPLSDDYIKFIRLAQYYVERNGEGIVAYISNNSFIDGLIHRQMRSELLRVFDKIYILDLHGNARKNETCPDGSKDENVFDIMQGVSINIFVKKAAKSKAPAEIYHCDLYGTRETKYAYLKDHSLTTVEWSKLSPQAPSFFFVPKDFSLQKEYEKGFKVEDMMPVNTSGIKTHHDGELVSFDPFETECNRRYNYRPFDDRFIEYDLKKVVRHRYDKMRHLLDKDNLSMIVCRQQSTFDFQHVFCTQYISDMCSVSSQTKEGSYVFPLYLYPEPGAIDTERRANIDETIANKIAEILHYAYVPDSRLKVDLAEGYENVLYPEDIFDYIYGILHSPHYREKYKEFLKVDFPRIPYPKNADEFDHFRTCGHQLRELHLMHSVPESDVYFPEEGSMIVDYIRPVPNIDDGYSFSIYINDTQYFTPVPVEAWNMYIGGYQPAQKWLKDRKGRKLEYQDIEHYERIIAILLETARIMRQIDDPNAQVAELKKKVHDLEHQLQSQNSGGVKIIGGNVTYIDNSTNYNIKN